MSRTPFYKTSFFKKVKRVMMMDLLTATFLMIGLWIVTGFEIARLGRKKPSRKELIPPRELKSDQTLWDMANKKATNGFVFGKSKLALGEWVVKPENKDGHIMIVGGPGSGKTSCVAIPTMATWRSRLFAIDIKGELFEKSNRANVKVMNPLDHNSFGYDPFYILRNNPNKIAEIRKIAMVLIPIPAKLDSNDSYFLKGAVNFLSCGLIHYQDQGLSFIECIKKLQLTTVEDLINEVLASELLEVQVLAQQFADTNPKEIKSFVGEVRNHIVDFVLDPDIRQAFSKPSNQCVKPIDLERGFDIFLQVPERKLAQWGTIFSLIVAQFLDHFTSREEYNNTPILFLLDEFPRLGKLGGITEGLATLRSKNITMCIIIQSLKQLDFMYGDVQRSIIADNCRYKAVLEASDPTTQEYFSDLIGTSLQMRETTSRSTNTNPVGRIEDESEYRTIYKEYAKTTSVSESTSYSYQRDKVVQPHELGALEDIVLIITGKDGGYFRVDKTSIYDNTIREELKLIQQNDPQKEFETLKAENVKNEQYNLFLLDKENAEIEKKNAEVEEKRKALTSRQWVTFFLLVVLPFFLIGTVYGW